MIWGQLRGGWVHTHVPAVDDVLYHRLVEEVVRPTVGELVKRGIDYRGVFYAGLMLTSHGPEVLEFNCVLETRRPRRYCRVWIPTFSNCLGGGERRPLPKRPSGEKGCSGCG